MGDSPSFDNLIKQWQIVPLKLYNQEKEKKIIDVLSCLVLTEDKVKSLANLFSDLLIKGLQYDGSSPFFMQNTFVYNTLKGEETGTYFGFDLGGTNFRIVLVELSKGQIVREEIERYDVPENLRVGSAEELFDFLAKSLADFAIKRKITGEKIPLGFTFSFPTEQHALNSASLKTWIGKFNVSGVVGQDVAKLLQEAISRATDIDVSIVAVLNDTVGTLLRGSIIDKHTAVSLILGTGSNACYFEKTNLINGFEGLEKEVAVNIEWGPFTDDGRGDIIKTKYDEIIDNDSLHPNLFTFEKYVGSEFFGKLVRAIILDLANQDLIFEGRISEELENSDIFESEFISQIEEDNIQNTTKNTKRIIANELKINWCSDDDVTVLKHICELVSLRLAVLVAMGLSEIIKRMDRSIVTVACDGSLYKYHPRLQYYITNLTSAFLNHKTQVKLISAEDGSGIGAALVAALACNQKS